jgi:hypothetical protein
MRPATSSSGRRALEPFMAEDDRDAPVPIALIAFLHRNAM